MAVYTIYALVDPNTHEVRYVGQTRQPLAVRFDNHLLCARTGEPYPVYDWMRSLAPIKPFLVILERVDEHDRVPCDPRTGRHDREHKAHTAEVKWMKRFQKFSLLQFIDARRKAYRRLVNPWEEGS